MDSNLCFHKPDIQCDYDGETCIVIKSGYTHINQRKGIRKNFVAKKIGVLNSSKVLSYYCVKYIDGNSNGNYYIRRLEGNNSINVLNEDEEKKVLMKIKLCKNYI